MPNVDILCLANARKLAGRCVAGLRVDGTGWVRPVSKLHDGILNAAHVFLDNGKEAAVLNVIEMGLKSPRPDFHQPENWLLDGSVWKLAKSTAADHAAILRSAIVSGPELLRGYTDRVACADLRQKNAEASLAVIAPKRLDLVLHKKSDGTQRVRGRFWLGDRAHSCHYDLSLTDPPWEKKVLQEGSQTLSQTDGKFLVTISLGEPFHDCCYKVIAAIIHVPPPLADLIEVRV
jgi:hypothetical protein